MTLPASERHDYARTWRKVAPGERDRRLSRALSRLAEGDTLERVAATWRLSKSDLCRALIAYAPLEWRRALTARALVRYCEAEQQFTNAPLNPIARARAWRSRWYFDHALKVLAETELRVFGREIRGPCPQCGGEQAVYAKVNGKATCYRCGWEGAGKDYVLGQSANR